MSTARIKYIKNYYPITSATLDTANNKINVDVGTSHNLFNTMNVELVNDYGESLQPLSVTVTGANTYSVNYNIILSKTSGYRINGYLSSHSGVQQEQTLPRATGTETIIQSYVTGTGGATYSLDVSLDKSHWITLSSLTHSATSGNTLFTTISPGWPFYRANVASVGANTNLVIISGE